MSVLVDSKSRVLVQGITGREGAFHTEQMRAHGTNVVAGVSPGKGGQDANGVPIFDTVAEAVTATGADVSGIFVPPPFAADAIMESAACGIALTVCITEGIPVHDMIRARAFVERARTLLLGPNCPGLVTPGQCKVGIIPNHINIPGPVGIVGRSGTLTYEVIQGLGQAGMGQTTSVGIGGDPVLGLTFSDVLALFAADSQTRAVVMIGEIGGADEETGAEFIRSSGFDKPVVAFISGRTAPPGKRMGHAGAIISGNSGTAQSKIDALTAAGADIADTIEEVVRLVGERLGARAL
ncbi:MAG: succinate--CoA ligase subunit alpha [Candidatus Dormibacteraeota bacterium]|uniref:Succinate--CoA ligase [ADP-forming] subunit alpha n=1 Tax=Candidatus Amunia macphersoniae TaxID=3127014 RepID=A0A934KM74_9BACT|nr:succinate--CoA ligase subunit alpha [Candidatus Dormibacteraeota bacterium]